MEDGIANIRVAECNGAMWGVVAWEKTPSGIDKNNPDASKKTRPTLGIVTLINMKKNAAGDKWAGQVYNAKDGKFYKSTIKLGDTPDELEIEGCVLGFLCGGQTWTRVGPPIPSSPANALAKGAPPKTGAPASNGGKMNQNHNASASTATAAPKTPPAVAGPKKGPAQSTAAAAPGQPADIGDICLLPEIAGFAH